MSKAEVLRLTTAEELATAYRDVLGERIHVEGALNLFNDGVFAGIEILAQALSKSEYKRANPDFPAIETPEG